LELRAALQKILSTGSKLLLSQQPVWKTPGVQVGAPAYLLDFHRRVSQYLATVSC